MQRKTRGRTILLVLFFLAGLILVLYPTFRDYWNSRVQSHAVATYVESIKNQSKEETDRLWKEAEDFNEELKRRSNPYGLTPELKERYSKTLDITGTGIMGYIDIPCINVALPIYHGTDESVLQFSIGHIEWSYLPVGGADTHSALSGHRGLPSAKLFTDLDRMVAGDLFILQILDQTLTYEVDQILVVDPDDVIALAPEEGEDYCTLETCTPYGVNSHRLLVRGHRVENLREGARVVSEAMQVEPMIVAIVLGVFLLVLLLIYIKVRDHVIASRQRKKQAVKMLMDMLSQR